MITLPKLIYRFSAILIKISTTVFAKMDKLIPVVTKKGKRPKRVKIILKRKIKVGGLISSDFKTLYKSIAIKTMWYWPQESHTDGMGLRVCGYLRVSQNPTHTIYEN